MKDANWVVLDTETNGLNFPICTVEISAQRMHGWDPVGEAFHVLLNHDVPIDPEAERLHGYSRSYLQKNGTDPRQAHAAWRAYVCDFPVVAYNLSFDWNRVLVPEYQRLRVPSAGQRGFCALTLARRCIRDSPNYRFQTIVQQFGLSSGQAHRAKNDVIAAAIALAQDGERIHFSGTVERDGWDPYIPYDLQTILDIYWMSCDKKALVKSTKIRAFATYQQIIEHARGRDGRGADEELSRQIRLVGVYGKDTPAVIEAVRKQSDSPDSAQMCFSTAHRAKGREWGNCVMLDDYLKLGSIGARSLEAKLSNPEFQEEMNLIYVAMTRASHSINYSADLEAWLTEKKTAT